MNKDKKTIIVATIKSWNIDNFKKLKDTKQDIDFILIKDKKKMTSDYIMKPKPTYIFFPHWSWTIPPNVYKNFNCIVFHMTDLPFGRGGSPLQNLIIRGIKKTKICAIHAVKELDAGDIYLKRELNLNGSAEEIYRRASDIIYSMIEEIIVTNPKPKKQKGRIVTFKRRTEEDSRIPLKIDDLTKVYDYIRMLDAEGYPEAFIDYNNIRIKFKNAQFKKDYITTTSIISLKKEKGGD